MMKQTKKSCSPTVASQSKHAPKPDFEVPLRPTLTYPLAPHNSTHCLIELHSTDLPEVADLFGSMLDCHELLGSLLSSK